MNKLQVYSPAIHDPGWGDFGIFCAAPVLVLLTGFFLWKLRKDGRLKLPRWGGLILFNGIALAFFGAFAFLLGECHYKFIYDTTDSYNYTFASRRWFDRYYQYNSAQLRDNVDYPEAIPSGKRRVTILGDSFTVAQGVKNVDDRYANLLRQRHPEWDVQVLAVDGLDTGPQLGALDRVVRNKYQMDLVVLAYCLNDVGDIMENWNATTIFQDWNTRWWVVRHSYFANTWYFRLKARLDPNIPNYFSTVREAYQGKTWDLQRVRLARLKEMVESNGGRFVVVTFPFYHALGPQYPFQGIHQQLGEFWQAVKTPNLDLTPFYAGYSPAQLVVNSLDAHPNETAHRIAAEAMDKFLVEELRAGTNRNSVSK